MTKILVIEDQAFLVHAISRLLTDAGHVVVSAGEGRAGIALFLRERPDLVITDIVMPGQGGLETIQVLREQAPSVPIIAMSGESATPSTDYLHMAKKIGANATLRKPIARDDLIEMVTEILRETRAT